MMILLRKKVVMSAWKWILAAVVAGTAVPAVAAPDRYTVDSDHTYPSLEMSHMGISVLRGKFNKTSGTATLDRAARTGSAEIKVDAASIDFGHDKINEMARTADFLNVRKFPAMTYRGAIRFKGDTPVSVDGRLTLLGVTRPVKLRVNRFRCIEHPVFKKEVCGADAEGDLNRADFGMTKYGEGGAGKIHMRIQVEAIREY
jgi:polyisoprenoid-binding protein YceI